MTPFRALYGRDPPNILDYVHQSASDTNLDLALSQQQQIINELKTNLKKSRITMEKQANVKRRHITFMAGDWVLMKLQPYRQTSVGRRESQKLSPRWFRIVKHMGSVTYLLDLPS